MFSLDLFPGLFLSYSDVILTLSLGEEDVPDAVGSLLRVPGSTDLVSVASTGDPNEVFVTDWNSKGTKVIKVDRREQMGQQVLGTSLGNVQDLEYDREHDELYLVDSERKAIVRMKMGQEKEEVVIQMEQDQKPNSIAYDQCQR